MRNEMDDTNATLEAVDLDPVSMEVPDEVEAIDVTEDAGDLADMAEDEGEEDSMVDDETDHYANLARKMDKSILTKMATELLERYEEDLKSRKPWDDRFARGMALLGIKSDKSLTKPFPGASEAVHPVLIEAMVQFNARAITELFPPGGPVKCKIVGAATQGVEDQRDRVEAHMNYQYVEEMPEAFEEMDKLTFRVSYEGSSFKKTYYDPTLGRMCSIYVSGRNIIMPYHAQSVEKSPRVSHRYWITHNDLLIRQNINQWRDVVVPEPTVEAETNTAEEAIANTESREQTDSQEGNHYIIEMQVYYDLPGFEDKEDIIDDTGAVTGSKNTGIALPYIVTIEKDSQEIMSIVRDWDEADIKRKREMSLTHYGYIPGFGIYYLGLLHLIGGLAEATSGTVRALLDSAQFAAAQGGFKSKEARAAKGSVTLQPGVYVDIDLSSDDLAKAFYTPPFKEPPVVLFQLLGALTDYARRFASTTEAMVGEQNNNGPVGTTLAIIEQGMKVFSAIHKRMHAAQMREFRILARLNKRHLPDTPVPIHWNGGTMEIQRSDYDDRVDVMPVSDPNLFSQTQRIALAQGVKALADNDPTGARFDKREVDMMMMRAMGVPKETIERIMPDPERNIMQLDVVTENQMMLMGKPVRAFPTQAHEQHVAVHKAFVSSLPPELQQAIQPAMLVHIAEHYAHDYRIQIEMRLHQMGRLPELQIPNYNATGLETATVPIDPQIDNLIAIDVAQIMGQEQPQQQQPDPEMMKAKAEADRKDMLAARDADRQDKIAARDMARKNEAFKQDLEIKDGKAAHEVLSSALNKKEGQDNAAG